MSNASKYRKKAVEYEQLKQFDRAVASYVRAIEENENAGEEVDVALFNKVGDLTLRQGRVTEAVTYYERAVEHYVSNSLFDNAIALCNKILRNAPGRSNVYFTLGRICGRKGLRSDATRNFLEYATRMQQEGRVDEGMRALAEVADLMPELTEVRRLVEEHAARAGISLTRRRETPTRAPVQPESEQVRSFGLSKDLVFLEIDYDAVRANREKTPPPQPLISVETAKVNAVHIAVPAGKVGAQTPTARLEDLMIFDPRNTGNGPAPIDDFDDTVVFDGASILKPYVDPETPVVLLPDLEPTEIRGTPAFVASVNRTEAVSTEVNAAEKMDEVSSHEPATLDTPAVLSVVSTVPEVPANSVEEVVALDVVEPGMSTQLFSELPVVAEQAEALATPSEAVEVVEQFASNVFETELNVAAEADFVESFSPDAYSDAILTEPTVESQAKTDAPTEAFPEIPFIASATPAVASVELTDNVVGEFVETSVNVAGESIEIVTDEIIEIVAGENLEILADVAIENVAADVDSNVAVDFDDSIFEPSPIESLIEISEPVINPDWVAHDIVNLAVEQEFNERLSTPALEGFTADEEPIVAAEIVLPEAIEELMVLDIDPSVEATAESGLLSSLDFDAMLEISSPEIEPVADFEAEDFAALNDEFAAARFARIGEPSDEMLIDAFESDNELPPLIFPQATDRSSSAVELIDIVDETPLSMETIVSDEVEFTDSVIDETPLPMDIVASDDVELIDFVGETSTYTVPASVDLVFLDVPADEPPALTPIALEVVEPAFVEDDLDDLFGDIGVPTAVVAAEATLVASSRCAELQSASDADPKNFILRRRLAEALFESGNRDAAINELGAALASAELAGALSDAADIADELVRVASDEVAHHQKRLELAIRLGDQSRLRDAYLDLADNLVRRGEDLRAKAVYARVLEMDPWDERARTALGDAAPPAPAKAVIAGRSDDGHVSLADWLRDDDEPVSTRLRMREPDVSGDEQDDFNALLKHFKEGVARSLGEDDYESHYDLGVAYKEMGLLDDAIGEFQMALRSRNNRLAAYEALGQCFLEQQSYKVAVTVLSRALHEPAIQDEQRVGILYLLGYSCEVLQRFDEARGYFQRVYATDIHFRDVAQRLADLERTVR